ncbi:tRNA lysidine(34) synthetase TilS [uncultured Photobacterium sp.]|uniref:tRNA lysidine(34) synthetase TilS n=1 Tax=uncultured Photobacterium sp. TaxID=173973 RepID=UPI002610E093|nr:tRNA lysidine(34) synthetase TilS [uncultured Photobacterium sp.]
MLYSRFCSIFQSYSDTPRRFVLALSGGLDSRVLLHLMGLFLRQHPQHRCLAIHVHHGLSANADLWSERCVEWSLQEGIECLVERVNLELGSRISVEQLARDERYRALKKHFQPGDILLTAQHADDQLETVLLALKRGSGPAGLAAMAECTPFASGYHLRPLLGVTRQQIEEYGRSCQLDWVEDESNQDTRYDRNFLRHQVAPQMIARWPGIRKAVTRSASLCGEQDALLQELLREKLMQAMYHDQSLIISQLGSERIGKQLIRHWLKRFDVLMPSQAQLEQIWHTIVKAKPDANPQLCWQQVQVRRYQQRLYLVQQWPDIREWQQECLLGQPCQLPQDLGELKLLPTSYGQLRLPKPDEEVSVRFDPEGLEVKPVGRSGKRKLKKLFQEYGVPSWNRRRTPLVYYGEELAAVAGLFVVEAFRGQDCDLEWHNDVSDVQC